jgi:hypothetical protein
LQGLFLFVGCGARVFPDVLAWYDMFDDAEGGGHGGQCTRIKRETEECILPDFVVPRSMGIWSNKFPRETAVFAGSRGSWEFALSNCRLSTLENFSNHLSIQTYLYLYLLQWMHCPSLLIEF